MHCFGSALIVDGEFVASEQLIQNEHLDEEGLRGIAFGKFEKLQLGQTTVRALVRAGLKALIPESVDFPFKKYSTPRAPAYSKPDNLLMRRVGDQVVPVAVEEYKKPSELKSADQIKKALEQGLYSAASVGVDLAVVTSGRNWYYLSVQKSISAQELVLINDERPLTPGLLEELVASDTSLRDPADLAETVWQMIWHATKEEPKSCLLTFIEIFVLKFLSDNLPSSVLPKAYTFYELLADPSIFQRNHGCTPIEHYINVIRPKIKQIFPDNTIANAGHVSNLFGLLTVISKTSVINGFSFMKNSASSPATFNRVFLDILKAFNDFGPLTAIDPEFKLRLYETFLKKSARQQKLGQFFTPRNVVKSIITMACMDELGKDSVVLDPACGVGGFVLEPLITEACLEGNLKFQNGMPISKIKLIGVDVDPNTHILAKANLLIHLAEMVRDPSIPTSALNQLMAETFVLMNTNETLGALEYPPVSSVDLIMTNPPYVTQGSRIYKDEIKELAGARNTLYLSDYYYQTGLGLESLFLRYISGALKPGGKAFVIVPQGMLSRAETSTKSTVLKECNVLGAIALPSNTFFNTPQKTYILALEKRFNDVDPRPDVFCAIARSIGESLDYRRVPIQENDLAEIAGNFRDYWDDLKKARKTYDAAQEYVSQKKYIKIVSSELFAANERWDSARLWSNDELVDLGVMDPAIGRVDFVDEAKTHLPDLLEELEEAKAELATLTTVDAVDVPLEGDAFTLRRGKRVRKEDCDLNPGDPESKSNRPVPVYSGANRPDKELGYVGAEWLRQHEIPIENLVEQPQGVLTINSNGSVGLVFVRYQPCVIHDDVTIVEINRPDIDIEYLATQLRSSIAEGNFEYEAKLYLTRLKSLSVVIPVSQGGGVDIEKQRQIAAAYKRFDAVKGRLEDFGRWAAGARMKNDSLFNMVNI